MNFSSNIRRTNMDLPDPGIPGNIYVCYPAQTGAKFYCSTTFERYVENYDRLAGLKILYFGNGEFCTIPEYKRLFCDNDTFMNFKTHFMCVVEG